MRTSGLYVGGSRRAVRLILFGHYDFMASWVGHKGASSCMPFLWCTALRRRTQRNGQLVDKWGNMQEGSLARGLARTRAHFEDMASKFAYCGNGARASTMALEDHFSVESRPSLVIDAIHISPMPLHLTSGITEGLLRLGIPAPHAVLSRTRTSRLSWEPGSLQRTGARGMARTLQQECRTAPSWQFSGKLLFLRRAVGYQPGTRKRRVQPSCKAVSRKGGAWGAGRRDTI